MFNTVELYLACNPETPSVMLDKVREALASQQRDGTAQKIEARYTGEPVKPRAR
jgi:hypothetical protein